MDSLTHVVLGACIGELLLDKHAGRKAVLWGALAQSVPDVDFVAGFWMPLTSELLAHRGFTHSILFTFLSSFFLALIAARWHKAERISLKKWFLFFLVEIACHLFLDAMNNYGIGWFEPFSNLRISFDVIYVADPLFTIAPLCCFVLLLLFKKDHGQRIRTARIGVITSAVYLGIALLNKYNVNRDTEELVRNRYPETQRYFTTPTVLNNLLWFVVLEDSTGFRVGYRSIFDAKKEFHLHHIGKNEHLLDPVHDHQEVMDLKKFSQGYYTVEHWGDTLVFNDLRFGQVNGWHDPKSKFAFHYFLSHPQDNELIVQRGRFAGFNTASTRKLFVRMFGLE